MNEYQLKKFEKDNCKHKFAALGFSVFKVTDTSVEAVATIFCSICGLFRTKILTFRREFETIEKDEKVRAKDFSP